jgi:hypothetical protein
MPTPAFICPYCRNSQFTATQDIIDKQNPPQNDVPNYQYSNNKSNDVEATIAALIICSPIFALVIWLWFWLLSPS